MLQHVSWSLGIMIAVEQINLLIFSFECFVKLLRVPMVDEGVLRTGQEHQTFGLVYLQHRLFNVQLLHIEVSTLLHISSELAEH